MKSKRTSHYRQMYDALPPDVRRNAREAYRNWWTNQSHPGVQFKQVNREENVWSARIDNRHHALCRKIDQAGESVFVWFWIGDHDEYEDMIG